MIKHRPTSSPASELSQVLWQRKETDLPGFWVNALTKISQALAQSGSPPLSQSSAAQDIIVMYAMLASVGGQPRVVGTLYTLWVLLISFPLPLHNNLACLCTLADILVSRPFSCHWHRVQKKGCGPDLGLRGWKQEADTQYEPREEWLYIWHNLRDWKALSSSPVWKIYLLKW